MKKTDNYGARVKIENIMEGEVDEDLLFALLTRLVVKDEVLDMDVMLASRCHEYLGHIMLAEKRLPSQSTSIQSPFQFPYSKTELRSWRDGRGVHSVGGIRGGYLMRRVAAVAVGLCLKTPLQELDSVKEFSAEELAEAWPRLRYGIYI